MGLTAGAGLDKNLVELVQDLQIFNDVALLGSDQHQEKFLNWHVYVADRISLHVRALFAYRLRVRLFGELPDSMSLGKLATYSSSLRRLMPTNWRATKILPCLLHTDALMTTIFYQKLIIPQLTNDRPNITVRLEDASQSSITIRPITEPFQNCTLLRRP